MGKIKNESYLFVLDGGMVQRNLMMILSRVDSDLICDDG